MTALSSPAVTNDRGRVLPDLSLALVVGCLAYALSCWIAWPGNEAKGFGIQWQMMSEAPFDLRGMFPHRLLAPLLSWALGLGGGIHYLEFVRGLGCLLLVTVAFFVRRSGLGVVDASLVTAAVALTAPIQLYKDHWVGYPDPICYALFLVMALVPQRPALFWGLFFVNLANHELAAFMLPWLWFLRRQAGGKVVHDLIGGGAALGAYAAIYLLVKSNAKQLFTYEYFASHPLFPGGSLVVWSLAIVHLVVTYGPILAVLAWHQHTPAHGRERWQLWLVGGGVAVIFCIAFDWARHSNLIVMPLVLASVRFLQAGQRGLYAALLLLGIGLMLWIPPWSPTAWPTDAMANITFLTETGVAVIGPPQFPGDLNVQFGPPSAALQNWLPRVWPMLATIAAIAAAIWLTGAALAWRQRARTA